MKRTLTVSFLTLIFFNLAFAQKVSTILGDAWTGEIVATNDSTREITIKYEYKGKSETFTGVLNEGYKVKMKDGTSHDLSVGEILIGTRIRVFSKTKEQVIGGRKIKVNLISRIDFLGKDEFALLREQLKIAPSFPVALAESNTLPTGNPLKVYIAVEDPKITDSLVEWVKKWNKENGVKYGSIDIVSDMSKADVLLASYPGSNLILQVMPGATVFLVVPRSNGLAVIWRQAIFVDQNHRSSPVIEKEIERRMKTRSK